MIVGTVGEVNPQTVWLKSKGMWLGYLLCVLLLHLILLSIPVFNIPVAWTLTNVIHTALSFVFLHLLKGAPWEPHDQGNFRRLTHWEQIDDGQQFTGTRKFFTVVPVLLFFLASSYTKYAPLHFYINVVAMIVAVLPKLPQFHGVRLFGINKY